MHCDYFAAQQCRSCTLLAMPHQDQVAMKQRSAEALLGVSDLAWAPAWRGAQARFRNKAKLVAGGGTDAPVLGILAPGGVQDLTSCPLHVEAIEDSLPAIARFISTAALTPYDIASRVGELKLVIVTASPDGELLVRFVLRSREAELRVRKHLPSLLADLPSIAVVSLNIQPAPAAILEGEREIPVTGRQTLTMRVNGLGLHLRPRSFFQTNTEVAAALYRQAADWIDEVDPRSVWDLYCGVGGFALHVTRPGRSVTGIEVSPEAIASATTTAQEHGLGGARFRAQDATAFALATPAGPDAVIVNPPRRGIGTELAEWLERSAVPTVLYSSCNPTSLARDLAAMPSLTPTRARLFDMFPNTAHSEVLVLLQRS